MNEEITKPPLYHGTDLRILKMSKEERSVFKKGCISAIDYMWQFIKPYEEERWHTINIPTRSEPCKCFGNRLSELQPILQDENDQYLYLNVRDAILCNQCRLKNNSQYLYGYTYFTTDAAKVKRYAMRAYMFGEIGKIAYRLYKAIEKMQPEK
ncbi:MAG: hypothetical protein HUK06_08320 [Bacteroidaceae bacterium]|nr:hypothetical protein [Bacteroidaceae bacterium]